jgi:UPF0042 nucleotide-binding protein
MVKRTDPGTKRRATDRPAELVIITGLSGSGKGSVLKALEDLGYYSVDNLPVDLIPKFAELTQDSASVRAAALVVDVREGEGLQRFPSIYTRIRSRVKTRLVFLEADDNAILRRFSETRRPHPLGTENSIAKSIKSERRQLAPIRAMADLIINTSKFTVHELRDFIRESFRGDRAESKIMVYVTSFGYRHGVPADSDLVFDVRFLPNPHFVPKLRKYSGRDARVARYIRSFPQTGEFLRRVEGLLTYLIPHYIREGKSYLTIAFGCTGGRHRSVMLAEAVRNTLHKKGYASKVVHRDLAK